MLEDGPRHRFTTTVRSEPGAVLAVLTDPDRPPEMQPPGMTGQLRWTLTPIGPHRTAVEVAALGLPASVTDFELAQTLIPVLHTVSALVEGPDLWDHGPSGYLPKPLHTTWGGGLPPVRRTVRLFPDYGRDYPLWESATDTWDVGITTGPDTYDLSAGLALRLQAWQREWESVVCELHEPAPPGAAAQWRAEGAELARLLAAEIGEFADVDYRE